MSLDQIAIKHGTDKSTNYHGYTRHYERYFADRPANGRLLELGWGGHEDPHEGGASARMWRDWLKTWMVVVVDNEEKDLSDGRSAGITLLHGDQADPRILELGRFDIIIDDASHLSSKTIESFQLLWPALNPGGWYVVEDTHMAYHDFYYGGTEAAPDPDHGVRAVEFVRHHNDSVTAMAFLKRLADEANFKGRDEWDLFPPRFWLGYEVEEVHFHFNICFVKKRG